jgi:hypothetical protein
MGKDDIIPRPLVAEAIATLVVDDERGYNRHQ